MLEALFSPTRLFQLVFAPLTAHFRSGPTWAGGWEGASDAAICAGLGSSEAAFWEEHEEECARIIGRRADAHLVLLQALVYLYVVSAVATRFLVIRPAARELAHALAGELRGGRLGLGKPHPPRSLAR